MPHSFGSTGGLALADHLAPLLTSNSTHSTLRRLPSAPTVGGEQCWPIRPTLRNELDTFSVHFYIFFGPNVSVPPDRPAVFAISLLPVLDSGGVLNLELKLNVVSRQAEGANGQGRACSWSQPGTSREREIRKTLQPDEKPKGSCQSVRGDKSERRPVACLCASSSIWKGKGL